MKHLSYQVEHFPGVVRLQAEQFNLRPLGDKGEMLMLVDARLVRLNHTDLGVLHLTHCGNGKRARLLSAPLMWKSPSLC